MSKGVFGLIVANRGFFPAELAREGRKNLIDVLKKNGYESVVLSEEDSKFGSVETFSDAKKCADLFRRNEEKIDGIVVSHPNFGEEKGILEAVRLSRLNVPILIQAEPDDPVKFHYIPNGVDVDYFRPSLSKIKKDILTALCQGTA